MSTSTSYNRPARPSLKPLTTLDDVPTLVGTFGHGHKDHRSYSVSSTRSTSSTSSTYSRLADDMIDRLASQEAHSTIDLWSAGNIRLNGRDLTMAARDAEDLLTAMKEDDRFVFVKLTFFDAEGEDWKISFRRSAILLSSPIVSDSE
ncbi:hypothetical protein IAU59_003009 [Kwoniella sp. CBS 9459]